VLARAVPESVIVDERYHSVQEVSRNPSHGFDDGASGRIRVRLPFDGHTFFPRRAIDDVRRALGHEARRTAEALVGHLVFTNYHHTNLSSVLGLTGRFGGLPLRVPVCTPALRTVEDLAAERHEYVRTLAYVPSEMPKLLPVDLDVELRDPDNVEVWSSDGQIAPTDPNLVAKETLRYINFESSLTVRIDARIALPRRVDRNSTSTSPVLRRVAVELPAVNSSAPSSMTLKVGGVDHELHHDPAERPTVEWFDVATRPTADPDGSSADEPGNARAFSSDPMILTVTRPGELFAADELVIEVEAEIPDELLSEADVRLFDAAGRQHKGPSSPLTRRTTVRHRCTVVLSDVFAKRGLLSFQQLHFDEVVPDDLRVADIASALRDQRFTIHRQEPITAPERGLESHFLLAERREGIGRIVLWVFVHGRRLETERRSAGPGGRRYVTTFDSGDIRLVVCGHVTRDSAELVAAVNELQFALRDRFLRLKALR
jgi:hypothetical protein